MYNTMFTLLADNPFQQMGSPITNLINMALSPALALVAAIGAIYCIIVGARLAKADEPQEREKAKKSLTNAVIGFVLIFVLLAAMKVGMPAFESWYNGVEAPTVTTTTAKNP